MKPLFQKRGKVAEDMAARYLRTQGFHLLKRNFRCRIGEIDIIAEKDATIYFVEVKGRWTARKGGPLEQITARKMKKLSQVAAYYLKKHPQRASQRAMFSVVGIDGTQDPPCIHWIPAAFEM